MAAEVSADSLHSMHSRTRVDASQHVESNNEATHDIAMLLLSNIQYTICHVRWVREREKTEEMVCLSRPNHRIHEWMNPE